MRFLYLSFLIVAFSNSLLSQIIEISPDDTAFFANPENLILKNELPNGYYKVYYDTLKTNLAIEGKINTEMRDSIWLFYYENGVKRREVNYNNGLLSGSLTEYYETGSVWKEYNIVNGFPDGTYTEWHVGERKKEEGVFDNGSKTGIWKTWDSNGNLISEVIFEKGIEVVQGEG
jgi:antitoxin component YwqK of YwqJK toxin-antitoxin module